MEVEKAKNLEKEKPLGEKQIKRKQYDQIKMERTIY
jgi:hypothetical protein